MPAMLIVSPMAFADRLVIQMLQVHLVLQMHPELPEQVQVHLARRDSLTVHELVLSPDGRSFALL